MLSISVAWNLQPFRSRFTSIQGLTTHDACSSGKTQVQPSLALPPMIAPQGLAQNNVPQVSGLGQIAIAMS